MTSATKTTIGVYKGSGVDYIIEIKEVVLSILFK